MPPTLRELAEDSMVHGPPRPGFARVDTDRWTFSAGTVGGAVAGVRIGAGDVAANLEEIRALAREHGQREVTWWVGDLATPADVSEQLLELGLVPDEDAPTLTSMAIERRPNGEASAEVRRVTDLDDYLRALEIDWEVWNEPAGERAVKRETARRTWGPMQEQGATEHYLAYLDGEPVAFGRAVFLDGAAVLVGGATLPAARGRGIYISLVHARWEAAVARGTPALVVEASEMSRPILERLGFEPLGMVRLLVDRL